MTSTDALKCSAVLEKRRRSPLEHLPPPANSNKPLTPFSIEDILSQPPSAGHGACGRARLSHTSPLCALEELASKTFKGLEVSFRQAAEGRDGLTLFGQRSTPKKRRKSRTAFTNHQIYELEKRFLYQKYLSPADRDQIAQQLALTNAQVITWFQNRRAKLKRDLEEMKADVESASAAGAVALEKLSRLAELQGCAAGGRGCGQQSAPGPITPHAAPPASTRRSSDTLVSCRPHAAPPASTRRSSDTLVSCRPHAAPPASTRRSSDTLVSCRPHAAPPSPKSPRTDRLRRECSEDEDEEIDVDD